MGKSHLVYSDQRSSFLMWRFLSASSRAAKVSHHVLWGLYLPGGIGIKSRIGRPNTHIAGESFVSLSGVFLNLSIAHWNASVLRSPCGPVLSMMRHFTVLMPISALQLLWGKANEQIRWCMPQSSRNCLVATAVYSGPPSEASSSSILNVMKVLHRQASPVAPSDDFSMIGQFEYLSTTTR